MKTCGIILAAGCSSRAGAFKMTCKIRGIPVIEYIIGSMKDICDSILVITGHHADQLDYLPQKYNNLRLVHNESYRDGMFSSVKAGLRACEGNRVFIMPGDCPAVKPRTFIALLGAEGEIVVPVYGGKKGHPVLIKKSITENICASACLSLRDYMLDRGYRTVETDDPGVLLDIDYPEDFEKITPYLFD